jgi:hypothetical protein
MSEMVILGQLTLPAVNAVTKKQRLDACKPAIFPWSALMRVFDLSPGLTIAAEISSIRNLNLTTRAARMKIGSIL